MAKGKPEPDIYLETARRLSVSPEDCVVFEDSLQGVKAGRASGAYVTGIAGTLPASVIEPYCDMVVNNFEELDRDALIAKLTR